MTPPPTALALLQEWQQLTVTETDALHLQDWQKVQACHLAKEELQKVLGPLKISESERQQLQPTLADVVERESANRKWLAEQKAELATRRFNLDDSARNLRRLRGSYVQTEPCSWHSYS